MTYELNLEKLKRVMKTFFMTTKDRVHIFVVLYMVLFFCMNFILNSFNLNLNLTSQHNIRRRKKGKILY